MLHISVFAITIVVVIIGYDTNILTTAMVSTFIDDILRQWLLIAIANWHTNNTVGFAVEINGNGNGHNKNWQVHYTFQRAKSSNPDMPQSAQGERMAWSSLTATTAAAASSSAERSGKWTTYNNYKCKLN